MFFARKVIVPTTNIKIRTPINTIPMGNLLAPKVLSFSPQMEPKVAINVAVPMRTFQITRALPVGIASPRRRREFIKRKKVK